MPSGAFFMSENAPSADKIANGAADFLTSTVPHDIMMHRTILISIHAECGISDK